MAQANDLTCAELVELVTDYLENKLTAAERDRFEAHLKVCPGCETYLDQIRQTIATTGKLREETLEPSTRDDLLSLFRDWKRGG